MNNDRIPLRHRFLPPPPLIPVYLSQPDDKCLGARSQCSCHSPFCTVDIAIEIQVNKIMFAAGSNNQIVFTMKNKSLALAAPTGVLLFRGPSHRRSARVWPPPTNNRSEIFSLLCFLKEGLLALGAGQLFLVWDCPSLAPWPVGISAPRPRPKWRICPFCEQSVSKRPSGGACLRLGGTICPPVYILFQVWGPVCVSPHTQNF